MTQIKPTIGVFFGSRSAEHDVSIVTALGAVIKPLESLAKYQVVPIYISKEGVWYSDPKLAEISMFSGGALDDFLRSLTPVQLDINDGLTIVKPGLRPKRIKIDIAFPATHGTFGEDGSLMGIFRMANVAFVGCDMPASVLAMDKVLAKQAVSAAGILTPKMVYFTKRQFIDDQADIIKEITVKLTYPLFVKPAHLGSSIGITRVNTPSDLVNAIEVAAYYDDKVLVEEGVEHLIEVTVPIMGNDQPVAAFVERPMRLDDSGFFDFDKKYIGNGKKSGAKKSGAQGYSTIPADIPPELYAQSEAIALAAYSAMGCAGLARIDLLINSQTNEVFFNEANPLPGQLYNHNWRKKGIAPATLVEQLVRLAQERHHTQQSLRTSFETNFLKQF